MAHERPIALVAEHDTWISCDPILGCPANCAYCYLGPLRLRNAKPRPRASPDQLAQALRDYLYGRRAELIDPESDGTPICIGNYTDMIMTPANRSAAIRSIEQIITVLPNVRPIVIITKAKVPEPFVRDLDCLGWPILWFFSQSFSRDAELPLEAGPIANFDTTLGNARLVASTGNQAAVHFWRPFVPELSEALKDKELVVSRLKESGMSCSVLVGLKHGPGVPEDDPRLGTYIPSHFKDPENSGETFDRRGWRLLATIARKMKYPLYRHTSCAIALNLRIREALGTWGAQMGRDRCLPCSCPRTQREKCANPQEDSDLAHWRRRISAFLGLSIDQVSHNPAAGSFHVDADVSEFDYNTLLHAARGRFSVAFRSVSYQKAWPGPW